MSDEDQIASKFRRLVELRETRDQTKTAADTAEEEYRHYEGELFDEIQDGPMSGTRRINIGGEVIAFTPRETKFGRIIDADAAVEFFDRSGMAEEMTRPKIEKRKLNELVRDYLDAGKSLPDGIDFYINRGITISRKG